ncbi:MAG: FAD-linked oxidase C-terminal domain-containing protein [Candidatus Cloacimonetes bacterium]|nr:FAD-linked oxidase C-terminal domain-containing protein [Candidatus Cloacimonadota bacterium]
MPKIYSDSLHRIAYSTDASTYREVPQGVAYPETVDDVVSLIKKAKQRKTHLLPRAAGTSIAGQVVGKGIVMDIKGWNKILEINQEEKWAWVQPGVVRDELNIAFKPYGLHFSPETSTSNRCCIGGMFGNNSCGTHSLIYGSTRHHVIACKGVLSDGSDFDTEKLKELGYRKSIPLLDCILKQLEGWAADESKRQLIEDNYPDKSLQRRSCGYAIDEAIEIVEEDPGLAICKLLAGSEGTLAFITEIKVSLDPLPPKEKMVVCAHCNTLEGSFEVNLIALKHKPAAVELMDGKILELSFQNLEQKRNSFFVDGMPAALLIAEFWGDTREEIDAKAAAFEEDAKASGLVYTNTRVYGSDVAKVWDLRKAGLGVLSGMKGDAKPIGVIEDTAVAPERLPAYMKDFREMLERLHTSCVYYGHISTGELHLRPIINIKTTEGKKLFREIAEETAKLVRKHKGSLSGEHGDGRLRGEFIPLMYGEEVYQLMREVKHCWDPDGVFNMNKIVDTPPMDEWLRFEVGQKYKVEEELLSNNTYYNWRAAFDECKVEGASGVRSQAHALMCSIEQCNGAGACLKSNLIGGTMCPAYKVSQDETKSTRARANILREILTRGFESEAFKDVVGGKSVFDIKELSEVLDSCLACKGCLSECPSNVDMTKLRSEILQQKYDRHGTPFRSWMVARMAKMEEFGAMMRPLYNFFATWKPSAWVIKKMVRFSTDRQIPKLSRYSMRKLVAKEKQPAEGRKVYLFADEFTNHQEADLGLTFAKSLIKLGYKVEIPKHVESGRAAFSKGCLKLAKKYATKNVQMLSGLVNEETPLVGIEPSCILSFRDEYPDIVPAEMRETAKQLAKNCLLFDEFIMREVEAGRITQDAFNKLNAEIYLHGHCHQKSLIGVGKCAEMLKLIPGVKVNVIPSGCCGMAGSFGYEKEHYETSKAIGEMVLFPTVRKATEDKQKLVIIAAPGTSCRQQILDGTGVKALHPIEILYNNLK